MSGTVTNNWAYKRKSKSAKKALRCYSIFSDPAKSRCSSPYNLWSSSRWLVNFPFWKTSQYHSYLEVGALVDYSNLTWSQINTKNWELQSLGLETETMDRGRFATLRRGSRLPKQPVELNHSLKKCFCSSKKPSECACRTSVCWFCIGVRLKIRLECLGTSSLNATITLPA